MEYEGAGAHESMIEDDQLEHNVKVIREIIDKVVLQRTT